jgi:prepilin signal peptidase PulO-like enzyme (type II secretory pathway)
MSLNDVLFACVCFGAVYARSVAAALFCAAYALHSFYAPAMEQWLRYVVLILIDSAAAFSVAAIKRPSRASVLTGVFSGVFLAVNTAGLVAWYLYLPPTSYDAVCSVVYIALLAALINEGSNGRRRMAVHDMGAPAPRAAMRSGVGVRHKNGGEV